MSMRELSVSLAKWYAMTDGLLCTRNAAMDVFPRSFFPVYQRNCSRASSRRDRGERIEESDTKPSDTQFSKTRHQTIPDPSTCS